MRYETLELGSSPCNEDCVQTTDPDYEIKALAECKRYAALLQTAYSAAHKGRPLPQGCTLRIKGNAHDFGTYYEVVVRFDLESSEAMRAAYWLEGNAPLN